MTYTKLIARHLRQFYLGRNWTAVNLKSQLEDVSLETAKRSIGNHNTILALVFHLHYYLKGLQTILDRGSFTFKDEESFIVPEIDTEEQWLSYKEEVYREAEQCAVKIEQVDDDHLHLQFEEKLYGDYYRTMHGIIEHGYYHLGQITLLKKLIN